MATTQQVNDFIKTLALAVQEQCKRHGWGIPSAIIAQAGLESAWGTSGLSKTCYNYWGMKWVKGCGADYKEYKTKEQKSDGTYYTITAKFRKWSSVSDGIDGYFNFIESYKRYIPVQQSTNYIEYANMLKSCGWATSLQYAVNIQNTVKKHNLTVYDDISSISTTSTYPTLSKGMKNDYVLNWQKYLNTCGYSLTVDGIFGVATENALKDYQKKKGLSATGIVDQDDWESVGK